MAKKETTVKETKEVEKPLKYTVEFPDGTIASGEVQSRQFAPNMAKHFQNTGYQCKISSGNFSGSLMIIDYLKQKPL